MLQHGTSAAAALHDVTSLGGFFALRVGGRDEGRHLVARSYTGGIHRPRRGGRAVTTPRSRASPSPSPHSVTPPAQVAGCGLHRPAGIVPDLEGLQRADDGPALSVPRAVGWYADRLGGGPVRACTSR
ncbi:hypothetical protein ACIQFU_25050 [Streptomyces sp. NPDC093065]|uniref:hypothetical protein n=1 Tax=Streptomyces sp. NPDC093065 TaxID=3366021 RepID=UPI0037FBDD89